MVLGKAAIRERLSKGEIFRTGTSDDSCVYEASYALRVAEDGLLINGKLYPPNAKKLPDSEFVIRPGEIAIFSTVERLNMPSDIVGHLGIRYSYAVRGLTGLMGIQVDPGYGSDFDDERLYLKLANLGNLEVRVRPDDKVFNVEFRQIIGELNNRIPERQLMWERLRQSLDQQSNPSWSHVTHVQSSLEDEVRRIRSGLEPVVMFGVFLLSVTLLGVVLALVLTFRDTAAAEVPEWVTDWGWKVLIWTIGVAGVVTTLVGLATATGFVADRIESIGRRIKN